MSKPRLLLTRRWPGACEAALAERFDLTIPETDRPLSPGALKAGLASHDAAGVTVTDTLDAEALSGARTRIIANFGVGISHIDLDAATREGVVVTNTPDVLTDCTADMAMGLMLAAGRRIAEGDRRLRAGAWPGWAPTDMLGIRLTGATFGVIGYGRIGEATAQRAHFGFGMKIVFFNRSRIDPKRAERLAATQLDSVAEVLEQADVVSLHCPGGAANTHLIDAAGLARMKPGAILVNTARGEVVDEAALAEALASGRIRGAGLDVYEREPAVHPRLLALENVVLAPHLGSASEETRVAMGMRACDNLTAFLDERPPADRVA